MLEEAVSEMVRRLQIINLISAFAFFLSSFCLLFIPFVNLTDGLPGFAYVIAVIFWIGLLVGIGLQIYLTIRCQKIKITNKRYRICYVIALLAFAVFGALVAFKNRSSIAVVGSLFCTIISLQSAAVIKRRECLK